MFKTFNWKDFGLFSKVLFLVFFKGLHNEKSEIMILLRPLLGTKKRQPPKLEKMRRPPDCPRLAVSGATLSHTSANTWSLLPQVFEISFCFITL